MKVYGARYPKNEKEKLESILNKEQYNNLKEKEKKNSNYRKIFIYVINNNLIQAINSILFSLNNLRHIIIVGEEGSGLTQVARWSAAIFSNKKSSKDKKKNDPYLCICSKKLQCEDLIGITVPNISNKLENNTNETDAKENKDKTFNNEILKF